MNWLQRNKMYQQKKKGMVWNTRCSKDNHGNKFYSALYCLN